MVSEKYRSKFSHRKTQSTMALDQSALLELLGELKLTDVTDRIRVATETLYQELIDAEAAAFIGAAPFERSPERVTQRNGAHPNPGCSRGLNPPVSSRDLAMVCQHNHWLWSRGSLDLTGAVAGIARLQVEEDRDGGSS